ncbi:hypothetical protein EC991_008258 [Linnemannia zychae]|nr:hypothetical protein EC991_008258 [Linnemannia zychae]
MVSLVLLILAPVALAALILGGTLIFGSKPKVNTNPSVPKLNITTTSFTPPSSIISTTHLPAKETVSPFLPEVIVAEPGLAVSSSLAPAITTPKVVAVPITINNPTPSKDVTTTKVPAFTSVVVSTTSKVPEVPRDPKLVTSKVGVTTKVVPEVTTSKSFVTTSNVAVTTKVIPEATTTKVPEVITSKVAPYITSKAVPDATSKVTPDVTTKVLDIVKPKIPENAKPIAVPTPIVPDPSNPTEDESKSDKKHNNSNKDKKKDDDESEEEEEQDWEDEDEDEQEDEEEEEDELPIINGTTGIQAADPTDGRSIETTKFESGSSNSDSKHKDKKNFKKRSMTMKRFVPLKQGLKEPVVQEQVAFITNNGNDKSVSDELTARLDKIVEEQSAPFEAQLERILSDLLNSQTATEYNDVLFHIQSLQHQQQQEKPLHALDDSSGRGIDVRAIINSLLQPSIIQFRTDVRNTVIFICGGQHDGSIDGKINGNDDYAKKAAQDDIIATTHPDGVHIGDLYDPQTGALVLECLKTHFGHLTKALGELLSTRFAGLKEFLLNKVATLAGIPRFLIPFSQDSDMQDRFVEMNIDELSGEEEERIRRSVAFSRWLVDSVINELQVAVEQDQDINVGSGDDARSDEVIANLPDNDVNDTSSSNNGDVPAQSEKGSYQGKEEEEETGEEEEISRSPPKVAVTAAAAAREPSQPRIRSRRSTNKKIR